MLVVFFTSIGDPCFRICSSHPWIFGRLWSHRGYGIYFRFRTCLTRTSTGMKTASSATCARFPLWTNPLAAKMTVFSAPTVTIRPSQRAVMDATRSSEPVSRECSPVDESSLIQAWRRWNIRGNSGTISAFVVPTARRPLAPRVSFRRTTMSIALGAMRRNSRRDARNVKRYGSEGYRSLRRLHIF
jgi:hypothetical protein